MEPIDLPLRDIHLPPPVSWWPPAPGWWALLALALGALALTWWWHWRARRPVPVAQAAALALAQIERDWQARADASGLVRDLSVLLRRVSVSVYPRARAASLTGEQWLEFLDTVSGDRQFSSGPGRVLAEGPYRRETEVDGPALIALCRTWIARAARPGTAR